MAVLQDNIVEPIEPPSNKPFVEQDLEKLRNTTAGVAWKAELKMYERKNTIRPVPRRAIDGVPDCSVGWSERSDLL